ncbi:hypothetical protein ACHAWF_011619 [Thalassiosira exigua]
MIWLFEARDIDLRNDDQVAQEAHGFPERLYQLEYPAGQVLHVQRWAPDADRYTLSANLGNDQTLTVKYSVNVWCGDIEVCTIRKREARANPDSPFRLCDVDLADSLADMDAKGEDRAHLRVFLNVVVIDGAYNPSEQCRIRSEGVPVTTGAPSEPRQPPNRFSNSMAMVAGIAVCGIVVALVGRLEGVRNNTRGLTRK